MGCANGRKMVRFVAPFKRDFSKKEVECTAHTIRYCGVSPCAVLA